MAQNWFARLSKWASRQQENFLSESLALVLTLLADHEPRAASRMLNRLTHGFLNLSPSEVAGLKIKTQVTTESGRPDIEIRAARRLAFIEVKDEAELGDCQLERYCSDLDGSDAEQTCLVLLTRYASPDAGLRCDASIRWHQVAHWLEEELAAATWTSQAARFMAAEFVEFLRIRGLAMTKVESGMTAGVRSLHNLCDLLLEAANRSEVAIQRQGEWEWIGLYLDGCRFNVGVRFDDPESVTFRTYKLGIDAEAAKLLPLGEVIESEWPKLTLGPYRWQHQLDLTANDGEFYRLDVGGQLDRLEQFIRESVAAGRSIERTNASVATGPPDSPTSPAGP